MDHLVTGNIYSVGPKRSKHPKWRALGTNGCQTGQGMWNDGRENIGCGR